MLLFGILQAPRYTCPDYTYFQPQGHVLTVGAIFHHSQPHWPIAVLLRLTPQRVILDTKVTDSCTVERSVSLVNLCEGEAGVQSIKSLAASTPGPLAQGFISNKSTTGTNGQLLPIQSLTDEQESDLHLSLPKTGMPCNYTPPRQTHLA